MNLRLLPYRPERDLYRLLGLPSTASIDEISAACRRLARTFHPDRNASARATEEMQVINAVRRVMTDPDARAAYDRERRRFHDQRLRPADPRAQIPSVRPLDRSTRSPMSRYLRATKAGLRGAVAGLVPRCRGCRAVIESADGYCAACGAPLLTGG